MPEDSSVTGKWAICGVPNGGDLVEWGFSVRTRKDNPLLSQLNNSTVREMASNNAAELAQEQAYVTMLYERLDVLRAVTQAAARRRAARADRGE